MRVETELGRKRRSRDTGKAGMGLSLLLQTAHPHLAIIWCCTHVLYKEWMTKVKEYFKTKEKK